VSIGIGIQKTSNHPLIGHLGLRSMGLEEIHASLAQRNSDLDTVFFEYKLIWGREEILNDLQSAERFTCVLWNGLHRASCLCANSQRQ
jgi:hypothetical protein